MTSMIAADSGQMNIAQAQAQAGAIALAQYQIAIARPRNPDAVRVTLLNECRRPAFAGAAIWRRPVGNQTIDGPSIGLAKAYARAAGNMRQSKTVVHDDHEKRKILVQAIDLETNSSWEDEVTISKTVERRRLKRGQQPLGTRLNSYGETVYIVAASEEELKVREAAEAAKAIRNCILNLMPTDLRDELMAACKETLANGGGADPSAGRKRLVDAFAAIGVGPTDLTGYLGHGLDVLQPAELADLRGIYEAIREGGAKWSDYVGDDDDGDEPEPPPVQTKSARTLQALQARKKNGGGGARKESTNPQPQSANDTTPTPTDDYDSTEEWDYAREPGED